MRMRPHSSDRSPTQPRRHGGSVVGAMTLVGLALGAVTLLGAPGVATADDLDQTIDPDQRVVSEPTVIDHGHVDIGPLFVDDDWRLMIHDDAEHDDEDARSVWRPPDETAFAVGDEAILTVPDTGEYEFLGIPGGQDVHVIPQTQHPEVVWLGWNTQDPDVMATIDRGVTLSLLGVDGPGELMVYLQSGSFDEPDVLWDSRDDEPQPAWVDVNTHAHANWVFSEPGIYLVRLEATAELIDGREVADTRDLRFAVGDSASTDDALAADGADLAAADAAGDASGTDAGAAAGDEESGPALGPVVAIAATAMGLATVGIIVGVRGRAAKRAALSRQAAS